MKKVPRFKTSLAFGEALNALFAPMQGDPIQLFSDAFAKFIEVPYAIPAPSGRVALAALLHGLSLPKGGEVIMPSLTFHGVPAVIKSCGLIPRFVDINPETYCIDPDRIQQAISPATVAILPVHLYGRSCDMKRIGDIAKAHSLKIIEDCAQSCGGYFQGKRCGSIGDGAFFSFGPAKNLSALWAGMVTAKSPEVAEKANEWLSGLPKISRISLGFRYMTSMAMWLVTVPWIWDFFFEPLLSVMKNRGIDLIERLTDETPSGGDETDTDALQMPRPVQGRIALSQLAKLDELNWKRMENGYRLLENLQGIQGLEIPASAPRGEHIFLSFVVLVQDRGLFRQRLLSMGFDTHGGNMFSGPFLPGMEGTGEGDIAADVVKRIVHLPVYPQMTKQDIDRLATAVKISLV